MTWMGSYYGHMLGVTNDMSACITHSCKCPFGTLLPGTSTRAAFSVVASNATVNICSARPFLAFPVVLHRAAAYDAG